MERRERTFAAVAFGVHRIDHLIKRLFPPLVPIWGLVFGFPLWQLGLLMGAPTFGYVWTVALLASAGTPAVVGYISDVAGLRAAFLLLMGVVLVSVVPIVVLGSDRVYRPAAEARERAGAD